MLVPYMAWHSVVQLSCESVCVSQGVPGAPGQYGPPGPYGNKVQPLPHLGSEEKNGLI